MPAVRPVSHQDAVVVYEQGLQALQARDYGRAAERFTTVLQHFPEEKELADRATLYLNVCRRQSVPLDATPRTIEERVYAATIAINAGAYEDGLARLDALLEEDPNNDHVHYMLAVVHTLREDAARAIPHLRRAIELNPENRQLASQDADLEFLRNDAACQSLLASSAGGGRRLAAVAGPARSGAVR